MPTWLRKVVHALAPAAGAALSATLDAVTRGSVDVRTVAVGAVGAFIGYLLKPARPAVEPTK